MKIHEKNHNVSQDGDVANNNSEEFENERSTPPASCAGDDDVKTGPSSPEVVSSPVKNTGADTKGAFFESYKQIHLKLRMIFLHFISF